MKRWHLKQMQGLSLSLKIKKSKLRIKEWLNKWDDKAYISFSGGKDSTVLIDLVKEINPNIPIVFCNMEMQFPEVKRFVYDFIKYPNQKSIVNKYGYKQEFFVKDNFVVIKPKYKYSEVIKKYGYPIISKEQAQYIDTFRNTNSSYMKNRVWFGNKKGRYKISEKWKYLVKAPFKISDKCCRIMKKRPFIRYEKETGRKPIVGTLVEESSNRLNSYIRNGGCNSFTLRRPISRPLSFWKEQDILQYIKEKNLRYCSIYGKIIKEKGKYKTTGKKRTGCIFCGFGVHLEKSPNRFQKMKETHNKLYQYCINDLGMGEVLDYINVSYK